MNNNIKISNYSKGDMYKKLYEAAHSGTYISYLRGNRCQTENTFFDEISASFQFPWYFGSNWAALDECLCDLDWLDAKRIFIVVDDFTSIFAGEKELQRQLINYFSVMVDYWKKEGVPVEVWLNN